MMIFHDTVFIDILIMLQDKKLPYWQNINNTGEQYVDAELNTDKSDT